MLLPTKQLQTKKGECEVCPKTDADITLRYGNMWMCEECWERDLKVTAERMKPENQAKRVEEMNARMVSAHELMERSRQIDERVQIKTDLFNADTVPVMELKQAIDADATIIATDKQFVFVKACDEKYKHYKEIVFGKRQELLEAENQMRMWQLQVRTSASALSKELREQFKEHDINYQPTPPKTVKPAKTGSPKKINREDVKHYAAKYSVPQEVVQMICINKNITPEQAAIHASNSMKGQPCNCPACVKKV